MDSEEAYMGRNPNNFKPGNQLWKTRNTHGRAAIFDNAEQLWLAACDYFKWVDENPLLEHDVKGPALEDVSLHKMRPYTLHGLCIFLGVNTKYFSDQKNKYPKDSDFSQVIFLIEDVVYNQKFEGAAAGFLNANLISRDLGLADKKEVRGSVRIDPDAPIEFE